MTRHGEGRRPRSVSAAVAAVVAIVALAGAARAERVVAIGDIHGAYDELVVILGTAGLIDADGDWSGGAATLVQLGDYTDRGPGTRKVMDLLRRLQNQAAEAGGRVEVLLGNHEALNLAGELRDVSAESLAEFADGTDDARRREAWTQALKAARARAKLLGAARPSGGSDVREAWLAAQPAGVLAYREALGPEGEYGRWLRSLATAVTVDGVLFMHAGLSPEAAEQALPELNRQVQEEIARIDACRGLLEEAGYVAPADGLTETLQAGYALLDQLRSRPDDPPDPTEAARYKTLSRCEGFESWHLFSPAGPLWFRGYAYPSGPDDEQRWSDEEGVELIEEVLRRQGVDHVVVAHSPQRSGEIGMRFDGRAFLIDTGMLTAVYRGRPSALEIADGVFTAIYPDERRVLLEAAPSRTPGDRASGDDTASASGQPRSRRSTIASAISSVEAEAPSAGPRSAVRAPVSSAAATAASTAAASASRPSE